MQHIVDTQCPSYLTPILTQTTHKNLISVLSMCDIAYPDVHEDNPVMLGVLPFYHIYG